MPPHVRFWRGKCNDGADNVVVRHVPENVVAATMTVVRSTRFALNVQAIVDSTQLAIRPCLLKKFCKII